MNQNRWIRLYRDSLHNPKIVSLSDRQHRVWHNLLLVADDNGMLPRARDIACHLRMSMQEAEQAIQELVEAGLVDPDVLGPGPHRYRLHDWETHQYVSDTSAERTREYRKRLKEKDVTACDASRDVTVTPPEPEAEPDTETDSESLLSGKAKFENKFSGKGGRAITALLKARAEGLGLDVALLETQALAKHVRKPNGLFKKMVCDEIRKTNPVISETLIKAALTRGNDAAWGQLNAMLVGAA